VIQTARSLVRSLLASLLPRDAISGNLLHSSTGWLYRCQVRFVDFFFDVARSTAARAFTSLLIRPEGSDSSSGNCTVPVAVL